MKPYISRSRLAAFAAVFLLAPAALLLAQDFSAGSNGSFGVINVPNFATAVVDLPPDGVLHCTSVTVGVNARLSFKRNPLNTPVYLLAQGAVLVSSGGIIDISGEAAGGAVAGRGGPGGFDGGNGGFGPAAPANRGGDGHGPGRGVNATSLQHAAYATAVAGNTATYGNVLIVPLIGGSGGAGGNGNPGGGGGGGGGAILIASDTGITVNGTVFARSGNGSGDGSGGAIRLVAPTGGGNGSLDVFSSNGGSGRVRIDTTDSRAFRNLTVGGSATRGTRMFVFPAATPKLHLVEAAGQTIPAGAPAGVTVQLPAGSPATQTVRLRGEGFTGLVPVRVVVTPEHSPSSVFDLNLNGSANPAEVSTQITLPIGEPTRIDAWAR